MILMTEEIRNTLTEAVKNLIAAPSACAEAKATAENGSPQPAPLTKKQPRIF